MLSFSSDALTDCFGVSAQTLMIGLCGDLFSSPYCHQTHYNWREAFIIHVVTVLLQASCESVLLMGIKSRVGTWVGIPGKKTEYVFKCEAKFLIWSKKVCMLQLCSLNLKQQEWLLSHMTSRCCCLFFSIISISTSVSFPCLLVKCWLVDPVSRLFKVLQFFMSCYLNRDELPKTVYSALQKFCDQYSCVVGLTVFSVDNKLPSKTNHTATY